MPAHQLLDAAGRPRSPATMPGHHAGRIPPNKCGRYPADPPKVDEIVAVMRQAGGDRHGRRMRGLIVLLWRAGLRIHEALTLTETDLNERPAGGEFAARPGEYHACAGALCPLAVLGRAARAHRDVL
jgi:hypothetical protein